ncbi:FAD-dependent oxidoreductase [Candidatus Sumerlaeota bacterium]
MSTYALGERNIPCDDSWDVIVVGGGPAGCATAIAAAREDARTLLVEATGALGGMGTSGLVPAWCPFTDGEKFIYGALAKRVFETCKAGMPHIPADRIHGHIDLDGEQLKRIYDDMVSESGASSLFNTRLASVETNPPGVVAAAIMANKKGLSACSAKVYVDCSGDADLAAWAGAEYEKGDEAGNMQPATHCCIISNVDTEALRRGPSLHHSNPDSPGWNMAQDDEFPLINDCGICIQVIGPSTVGCNALHQWDIDNTDPESTGHGLMTGRKIADQFHRALQKYCPDAFDKSYLVTSAPLLGVRESRRIIGDYVLSFDDFKARRSFPDEIARNCYQVDIHPSMEEMPEAIRQRKEPTDRYSYEKGESHGIPYRCLTPKGLKNVLVAGRSISTDRMVQGSTRVMPVCLAMGEAAGTAAAMAARKDTVDVHALDTNALRNRLKDCGAYLPETKGTQPNIAGDA